MDGYFGLALESAEGSGSGIEITKKRLSSHLTCLSFFAERGFGEGALREKGRYYTLLTEENLVENEKLEREIGKEIATILSSLAGGGMRKVLAVGLGNPAAVVDALGAETMKRLSAGEKADGYLATLTPSVFGMTGLETYSVVKGVAAEYHPDMILCVDTLSTRRAERLYRAVQIGEGGIVPGGGVGNKRKPLSKENLGVPVISVGVPLLAHADRCSSLPEGLVVTPKEIDLLVPAFARALARGVEEGLTK